MFSSRLRAPSEARTRSSLLTLPSNGFGPSDFQTFYGLTGASATFGKGRTVAIVIAGDAPNLEADLSGYRQHYALPACTTANGCFHRLAGNGGTNYPAHGGWMSEAALDVDMVSAICPLCNITVLEAASDAFSDLATAVNTAAGLHVSAISNSYGISETGMAQYASAYNHPGIPITAAAGNGNFSSVQEVPAAFSTVTSVGGTFPNIHSAPREAVWIGTVGCSTIISKPAWQHDTGCSARTVADMGFLAADIAMYHDGSWSITYGTSTGAPAIAALYAMAASTANDASGLYANAAQFYNVAIGFDGAVTGGSCNAPADQSTGVVYSFSSVRKAMSTSYPLYLCTGQIGYNAGTGVGTPNGLCGFALNCGTSAPAATPTNAACPQTPALTTPAPAHIVENPNGGNVVNGCGTTS